MSAGGAGGQENCSVCDCPPPGKNKNHLSHYGAISCFNCKAFFKYCQDKGFVSEDGQIKYKCKKKTPGICSTHYQAKTKDKCKECRYLKCLAQGMHRSLILQGDNRKKFTRKHLHGFKKKVKAVKAAPAACPLMTTGSSSNDNVLQRMKQVIDAHQESLDEIFVDFALMRQLFHSHFLRTEWIEENSRALLKMLTMHASNLSYMMSKLEFFSELNMQDRVKLIERNAHLYINYIMARYFAATEGISQLSWLFGSKADEILDVEDLMDIQERSFYEANQWGHIIPLNKTKRLTIFSNCIEAIHHNFLYPQFFNGLLGYFIILTTDHWSFRDRNELTDLPKIIGLHQQSKEMMYLGWNTVNKSECCKGVGFEQLQNLIETLHAMSIVCDPTSHLIESYDQPITNEVCTILENNWIASSTKIMKKTFQEHQIDPNWIQIFFEGCHNKFDSFQSVLLDGVRLHKKRFEIIIQRHGAAGINFHPYNLQQALMFLYVITNSFQQVGGHINWIMGTDHLDLLNGNHTALATLPNWQIYQLFNSLGAFVHRKSAALKFQELIEELMTFVRIDYDVAHLFFMSLLTRDETRRSPFQLQFEKMLVKKLAQHSQVFQVQSGDDALCKMKSLFLEYITLSARLSTDTAETMSKN